jgi:hypothetical protein
MLCLGIGAFGQRRFYLDSGSRSPSDADVNLINAQTTLTFFTVPVVKRKQLAKGYSKCCGNLQYIF